MIQQNFLSRNLSIRSSVIEEAVEKAIQSGEHGVTCQTVLQRDEEGHVHIVTEAWVDEEVPYGYLYDRGIVFEIRETQEGHTDE